MSRVPSGPYREKDCSLEPEEFFIRRRADRAQGLEQGCRGALFPSTSAGEGEKQPLSLPMIDFRSRAMECTGEAEPSQWLWQVLLAPVSNPPPVAWGRGTLKGSGAKD